jgi:general stress protein 13
MIKYEKGKIVKGQVTGIEKYGIFVSLDEFYSGLIHISEISDGFVKNINDYVNIGETIRARIVEVDEENYHLKLSIKNMNYKMKRRRALPLEETKLGFTPLEEKLDGWIDEKMQELSKNNA